MWKKNLYMIKLLIKVAPFRILLDAVVCGSGYASWIFYSIHFIKYIANAMIIKSDIKSIFGFIVISAFIFGGFKLITNWYTSYYTVVNDTQIYEKLNRFLFDKAVNVEIACYDEPEFYQKYTLAMKDAVPQINTIISCMVELVSSAIASVVVIANMYSIDHLVILFVVFPLVGTLYFGKKVSSVKFKCEKEKSNVRRKVEYVTRCANLKNYANELRMTDISNVLMRIHKDAYQQIAEIIRQYKTKTITLQSMQGILTFLCIFQGVTAYGMFAALKFHTLRIDEFAVLTSAMVSASWILIGLSNSIMGYAQNTMYISTFYDFIHYEPKIDPNPEGEKADSSYFCIEYRNVSFKYKEESEYVLKNISFQIKDKEKVALVGINGAGKSTLIKLLLRLYDPTDGMILLNGRDIKEYNLHDYRRQIGVAFQDFQLFSLSLTENLLMGNTYPDSLERIKRALRAVGLDEKTEGLPKKADSVVTKEFDEDGVSFSGGELQKLAVARVLVNDCMLAVFDEPTSALDPKSENELFETIMGYCSSKTAVFISHRLSAAMLADNIYLLENGMIVEAGTHQELMQRGGRYKEIFEKQAESYLKEEYAQ